MRVKVLMLRFELRVWRSVMVLLVWFMVMLFWVMILVFDLLRIFFLIFCFFCLIFFGLEEDFEGNVLKGV